MTREIGHGPGHQPGREPGHGLSTGARIKLCGVRRVADALLCAEAGADELGVVLAPGSRRRISLDEARAIRAALPARLGLVGVFLDATLAELIEAARAVPLSALQLHGEAPELAALAQLGVPVYRALHIRGGLGAAAAATLAGAGDPATKGTGESATKGAGESATKGAGGPARKSYARLLLDGPAGGGAGVSFDWTLAREARSRFQGPLFVAGGLTPENVAEAVRLSAADGVDVSSGIEGLDGFKDAARVRAFVAAARAAFEAAAQAAADARREQDRWS